MTNYMEYLGDHLYIVETDSEEVPISMTIVDEKRKKEFTIILDWDAPRHMHELADKIVDDGEIVVYDNDYTNADL